MELLPALQTGTQLVIYAPHAARDESARLIAQLALRGPVNVLDGGNRFQAYRVAQLLRRGTVDLSAAARRLSIQRAFTCYQMLALLQDTPALRQPYLILDLLASFYDEHVPLPEVHRLLEACSQQLERLCRIAPVVVTLAPTLVEGRAGLVDQVCARADRLFTFEPPAPPASQPFLF
jgi:hypothetical protein